MHKPRLFRLFISSTFSDFVAEREALQKRVFPELEAFCRERGASFQAVDLRWGITEDAQQSHDTLRLCLEEVRRCQALSSPPNFAVLLGDRYGWEPVPARIPEDCWHRLVSAADEADQVIIQSAYRGPDRNAIPAVYQLKPRSGDWAESQAAERALLQALRRAADPAGFTGDERLAFFASATHQEIALGALAEQDETGRALHPEEHVHVYIRRIPDLPRDQSARAYLDWDVEHDAPDSDAHARLRALESQLQQRLPDRCRIFSAGWQGDGVDPAYLDTFCQQFLEDQKAIIERELAQVQEETASEVRNRAHLEFAKERSRNFRGRTKTLRRIARYLKGQRHAPLILHGEGGTGKSALLARAFDRELVTGDQSVRLIRFIGGIPTTESLYTLLTTLTEDLALAYDQPEPSPAETIKQAIEAFGQSLTWSCAERPLVLFLDALDQLENRDGAWMLQWLPKQLGKHTRIVASTRGGPTLQTAQRRYPQTCIELPAMPPAEGRAMLKAWLADARDAYYSAGIAPVRAHRLTAEQFDWVIEHFEAHGNPLWLKLAYEKVRHWTSYEPPRELPATVTGMIEALIDQRLIAVENHPPTFTTRALAYLSAARFGLSEEELHHALATDPEVSAEFEAQNARTGQEWVIDPSHPRLPPVLWSRLYFDLAPYLVSAFTDQTLLYRWFHREFGEVIAQRYLATAEQRETIHGRLAGMFEARAPGNDDLFRRTDISAQPQSPALRRVREQPWQLAQAGRQAELKKLLSDFGFCLGKCAANHGGELVEDWLNVKAEPSSEPEQWRRFILRHGHYLRRGEERWPAHKILLQIASEAEPGSPVRQAAEQWLGQGRCDWVWLKRKEISGQRRHTLPTIVLEGHAEGVNGAMVMPDGRILSWSDDTTLRIWDGESGAPLAVMKGHADGVRGAQILADGRILSWSSDRTLRLWDGDSGDLLAVLGGQTKSVRGAQVLPDGRILSWSQDGTLRLWDGQTGAALAVMNEHNGLVTGVHLIDANRLLSWSSDGQLILWEISSRTPLVKVTPFTSEYGSIGIETVIVLSIHEVICWSNTHSRRIAIWDLDAQLCVGDFLMPEEDLPELWDRWSIKVVDDHRVAFWLTDRWLEIRDRLEFVPDSSCWVLDISAMKLEELSLGPVAGPTMDMIHHVLTGFRVVWEDCERRLHISSGNEPELDLELPGHEVPVKGVMEVAPNLIASWSQDSICRIWDTNTGKLVSVLDGHSKAIKGVDSADPERLLTWSEDSTIRVWRKEDFVASIFGDKSSSFTDAIIIEGSKVVMWSKDVGLAVVDPVSGVILNHCIGHKGQIVGAADLGPERFVSWSPMDGIRVWDSGSGIQVQELTKKLMGSVRVIGVNDELLITESVDHTIDLWDTKGLQLQHRFRGHRSELLGVRLLKDGRVLSWAKDESLRIWSCNKKKVLILKNQGHTDTIRDATEMPDGRILSWSDDGTLRLWDPENGKAQAVMDHRIAWAHGVDGASVLAGDRIVAWGGGRITVWDGSSRTSLTGFPEKKNCIASFNDSYGCEYVIGADGGKLIQISIDIVQVLDIESMSVVKSITGPWIASADFSDIKDAVGEFSSAINASGDWFQDAPFGLVWRSGSTCEQACWHGSRMKPLYVFNEMAICIGVGGITIIRPSVPR